MVADTKIIEALKQRHADRVGGDGSLAVRSHISVIKGVDREQRLVRGTISAVTPDMDKEVVVPGGIDTSYFMGKGATPEGGARTVYWRHNYDQPVGTCRNLQIGDREVTATTFISRTAFGEDVLTMMEEGVVRGFSVGYIAQNRGAPTEAERKSFGECDLITRAWMILEYSITPMPCNPDALAKMLSKGLIRKETAERCGLDVDKPRTRTAVFIDAQTIAYRENK